MCGAMPPLLTRTERDKAGSQQGSCAGALRRRYSNRNYGASKLTIRNGTKVPVNSL